MFSLLSQIARPALVRRFIASIREDGARVALAKARIYTKMRRDGGSHSSLPPPPPAGTNAYLQGTWRQLAQKNAFHISTPALGKRRRNVAIIGDLNLPQCKKYRVEQLAAFWQAQGVSCAYSHFQDLPRATQLLNQATHLIEYRLQTTPMTEMLRYEAHRLRLPILYDIDDPLFSVSAYETYGNMTGVADWMKEHFINEAPKYLSMMSGADVLSMSTPRLVEHAGLYSRRPAFLRRNFADAATLADGAKAMAARAPHDGVFRVAFASGSQGHEVDFAEIAAPLAEFILAAPNRRLLLLGHFNLNVLPEALRPRCKATPFSSYAAYLSALARADCAIMPLADDAFNRCKSAVRVIDASSVGVPAIVGHVGDLAHMIEDGVTGHIAHSTCDWTAALSQLADDPAAARAMGAAARASLETRWTGQNAPHIIDPEMVRWVTE